MGMLVMAGVCMLALAGCGEGGTVEEPIRTSTIVLSADGSFTQCRVGSFDKDYYQLGELETMIRQEVRDYVGSASGQASDSPAVAVEQVSVLEEDRSQVMVALHFADSEVYEDYTVNVDQQSSELFYGTVKDALARGYDLAGSLLEARKGAAITAEQLEKSGEKLVLIFEDALQIRCPSKVLYISGNVRLTEAGYVDGTAGEGLKYVVIK